MGRRKIEIKAIKDDRNRSVTFLKRKGGLFKKAHELSVLCSVDVAVFIFGNNNKKLYEYSSADMRELIPRYQYHGVPNEHKGPSDFQGGNDDDEDEDVDATPPRGHSVPVHDGMDPQMMPQHFHPGQASFHHIRHHTASASPPISNGVPFHHPAHHLQRGHTPQPVSRPSSRNDVRRMTPGPVPHPGVPQGPPHGMAYMPAPPIFNQPPSAPQAAMMPQPNGYYQQPPPPSQPQPQPYIDDRRQPPPPSYTSQPPTQNISVTSRPEPSPPQPHHQPIPHIAPHMSPPPQPHQERRSMDPQPPSRNESSMEERPIRPPLLNTDSAIRKLPQRKGHSIFTPIEDNRSILSQHLASFEAEPLAVKAESAAATNGQNRARSVEPTPLSRNSSTVSPPKTQRPSPPSNLRKVRTASESSAVEPEFTPPSRSNSFKIGAARTRGPRLTVQIPDGGSEPESATGATGDSNSPRNHNEAVAQPAPQRPNNPLSAVVLPPPSPSASALLSAGATGPPNPFARPVPQQNVVETPASALPSRFLHSEFLHSPSNFYQDWPFRGDSNTLPSPNFATPIHGSGPSFLREEIPSYGTGSSQVNGATKRKSPDYGPNGETEGSDVAEAKRPKIEV